MKKKKSIFNRSVIFITGGSGSWGNELVTQLLAKHSPKEIRIYSRGEHKQVEMKRKFQSPIVKYIIGDVRDRNRLISSMEGSHYVFHLAALKHVPVCEDHPWEAVQTNIVGTQNVIDAAIINKVRKVIDVSTDKAVDPLNLYGVTKSCGEKLIIAANMMTKTTKFVCVRGGNVMGTNGSVIPLFREQIRKLNEITITDETMSRFLMRVSEAISLLLFASEKSFGGEIFVMKMPACQISTLASVMVEKLGNKKTKMSIIGPRPGEKMYEVLVSRYEIPRTFEMDNYFVILPQILLPETAKFYKKKYSIKTKFQEFNSNNTKILTDKELTKLLTADGWFDSSKEEEFIDYLKTLKPEVLKNYFKTEGWVKAYAKN